MASSDNRNLFIFRIFFSSPSSSRFCFVYFSARGDGGVSGGMGHIRYSNNLILFSGSSQIDEVFVVVCDTKSSNLIGNFLNNDYCMCVCWKIIASFLAPHARPVINVYYMYIFFFVCVFRCYLPNATSSIIIINLFFLLLLLMINCVFLGEFQSNKIQTYFSEHERNHFSIHTYHAAFTTFVSFFFSLFL